MSLITPEAIQLIRMGISKTVEKNAGTMSLRDVIIMSANSYLKTLKTTLGIEEDDDMATDASKTYNVAVDALQDVLATLGITANVETLQEEVAE